MHIAIIGATGVYGKSLIPLLAQQGHRVCALVRSADKARAMFESPLYPPLVRGAGGIEIIQFDLLAPGAAKTLATLLAECDAVMHLATSIPRDASAPGAWENNTRLRTDGTRALLNSSLAVGVNRYIQQSITMAYVDGGDNWLDESTPLDESPARASVTAPVRAMEAMVRAIPVEKVNWCILRGGSFVGSGTAQEDTIARLREGKVLVAGDGSNFISPIHVADMASATVAALNAPAGSTFNIVAEPIRQGDYLDQLALKIGAPLPPRDPTCPRPPSWRCSNRAAQDFLKWKPAHQVIET